MIVERRKVRSLLVLLFAAGLASYFAYHAIDGRFGLESRRTLLDRAHQLEVEVARLEAVRAGLEHKTALLGGTRIDQDLLDETARPGLGYANPDDVIIMTK